MKNNFKSLSEVTLKLTLVDFVHVYRALLYYYLGKRDQKQYTDWEG